MAITERSGKETSLTHEYRMPIQNVLSMIVLYKSQIYIVPSVPMVMASLISQNFVRCKGNIHFGGSPNANGVECKTD